MTRVINYESEDEIAPTTDPRDSKYYMEPNQKKEGGYILFLERQLEQPSVKRKKNRINSTSPSTNNHGKRTGTHKLHILLHIIKIKNQRSYQEKENDKGKKLLKLKLLLLLLLLSLCMY